MSNVFFGGVPTGADVRKLLDAFPDIKPGDVIAYADVAKVIGADHGSNRFKSVTDAWRKTLLRTSNLVIEAVTGRGFRRLPEQERSERDREGWRKDQSRAARKVRDLARTDTRDFTESEQHAHDHARRVLQAHLEHTSTTVRELAPPPQLQLLPKRQAR